MPTSTDPFFEAYDRDDIAYGIAPSRAVQAFLDQSREPEDRSQGSWRALDLGAGAGRDTLALAHAGFEVTAVDLSERGLQRISQRAQHSGVADRVQTLAADVRDIPMPRSSYAAIVATTVLDHLPPADSRIVWDRMTATLSDRGFLFVEVHTTDDPGCDQAPKEFRDAPVSETAGAVINYFAPNQLASWATESSANLRILSYQERLEWDRTHGPEHLHGKAILLAVRQGFHPAWYGQPPAFPRPGT